MSTLHNPGVRRSVGPHVVVALVLRDRGLVLVAALLDDLAERTEREVERAQRFWMH